MENSQLNQFFCRSVFICQVMDIVSTVFRHFAFQVLQDLLEFHGVPEPLDVLIQMEK